MGKSLRIGIIGAGIGGMTAALAMLRAGLDVHVYEQADDRREVGAGIQISPNASRILIGLGLGEVLATTAVRATAFHQRRWDDGRTLLQSPLGDAVEREFGFPHYQMHRGDLLKALVGAFPPERLHRRHRIARMEEQADRVLAVFENGNRVETDALIGADGIHSTVRRILFGTDAPRFTGVAAYRGLVPADRIEHLRIETTQQIWMGPGMHFVHYFVRNRTLLNFVAAIDRDDWTDESWTRKGSVSKLLARLEGWHPQVREIVGGLDETFEWALFERSPMPKWSSRRATLLGDACHAMLPFMAQGAAQAIEDAAVLAACLASCDRDGLPEALHRYERVRIPRTSRIQAMSGNNKTRFHLPDGPDQQERDRLMATEKTDFTFGAIGWIYGHDAAARVMREQVNSERQSLAEAQGEVTLHPLSPHTGSKSPSAGVAS